MKPERLSTMDPLAFMALGRVSNFGASKYEAYNYLKGYAWNLSIDAAMRHLLLFWSGEDNDAESGLPHVLHAAWHCLALYSFMIRDLGTDDRPPKL